jgi:hypothetical protein
MHGATIKIIVECSFTHDKTAKNSKKRNVGHKVNEICTRMARASTFTASAVSPECIIRGNSLTAVLWTLLPEIYLYMQGLGIGSILGFR